MAIQSAIQMLVGKTALLFNVASVRALHEYLPGKPSYQSKKLLELAHDAGVKKILFLRHGKTGKAESGIDFDRLLTAEGRDQAISAGKSFGKVLKPFFSRALVSPAPRTIETAELFFAASDASVELKSVKSLYDGAMQPDGSLLFRKLGYAPLSNYLNNPNENDQLVAKRVLGAYAQMACNVIVRTLNDSVVGSHEDNFTLCFIGHAIYLPAAALGVSSLIGCEQTEMDVILTTNTREAEGYVLDLKARKVSYLSRDER